MKRVMFLLIHNIFPILILFLEIGIFLSNYKTGTYFVGWDNLFPELNFSANFKRSIFGVWQEYRGLGLLDGMSFAANLPHYLFIYLLSFVLPQNILRYFFVFLMHLVGAWGMYFLLIKVIAKNLEKKNNIQFAGFVASVFYMLNPFTVQIFFAPYELFLIHYAFLPWIALFLFQYLSKGGVKNQLLFILFSFFIIPQAHVPTVFIVYLLFLFVILLVALFFKITNLKKVLFVILTTFILNSFWLLPFVYASLNNTTNIAQAKINQMTSEDVYLKNKYRATIGDVLWMRGFMLDMVELKNDGSFDYVMKTWREHSNNTSYKAGLLTFFVVMVVGIIYVIWMRKKWMASFLIPMLISFFFLANNFLGFSIFYDLMREKIPIFAEIFRFSFTKFAILYIFCFTVFLFIGILIWISIVYKFLLNKKILNITANSSLGILVFLVGMLCLPIFKGNFLYGEIKAKIPEEYFQAIKYFNKQPENTRVALFPQPYYWSWRFYEWGSRGSGFLWYGIKQVTLDRAFDPWSSGNENYYWELSYALYSKDETLLGKVFEKYQINWLLVDENVTSPFSSKSLSFEELRSMLTSMSNISLVEKLGKIEIYNVSLTTPVKDFTYIVKNLPKVSPEYKWNNYDRAYADNKDYIFSNDSQPDIYYPFRSLFTGRSQKDLEFEVSERGNNLVFSKKLLMDVGDYYIKIPQDSIEELVFINPKNLGETRNFKPEVVYQGGKIEVIVPKTGGYLSASILPEKEGANLEAKNCNQFTTGKVESRLSKINGKTVVELSSMDGVNCSAAFWLPNLSHKYSYLITTESANIAGKSLLFWLENLTIRKADLEVYLPKDKKLLKSYFIQPPMAEDGLGYSLHFDNSSIGREKSINLLGKAEVNLIPYKFLTELVLVQNKETEKIGETGKPAFSKLTAGEKGIGGLEKITVVHSNPSVYEIESSYALQQVQGFEKMQTQSAGQENLTLVLSQAYNKGWIMYSIEKNVPFFLTPILGKKIGEHVLVNNWENGFLFRPDLIGVTDGQGRFFDSKKIVILFWPQYLEYLGFFLMGGYFLCLSYRILETCLRSSKLPKMTSNSLDEEQR